MLADFTGTWKLDREKSDFGYLPPPRSRVDRIEQTVSQVRIVTHQIDANGDNTIERVLPLDGSQVDVTVLGRVRKISARREGDELVLETRHEVSGQERRIEDRWSLDAEGLTVRRRQELPGGAVTQTLLLRRV